MAKQWSRKQLEEMLAHQEKYAQNMEARESGTPRSKGLSGGIKTGTVKALEGVAKTAKASSRYGETEDTKRKKKAASKALARIATARFELNN